MPKKKHKPEEIVAKLRQADVLISQGQSLRPASSGKHHGDQNGAYTDAPAVQPKTSDDMAHADVPFGAPATALG
jgi:hypothetical protein